MHIKTSPVNALSIEELIYGQAFLELLSERVHENGYDIPAGLKTELDALTNELNVRLRADKQRQLAVLELRAQSLQTREQKAKAVDSEIARLRKELGVAGSKTARR